MSDARLRALERAAQLGDGTAGGALARGLERAGLRPWWWEPLNYALAQPYDLLQCIAQAGRGLLANPGMDLQDVERWLDRLGHERAWWDDERQTLPTETGVRPGPGRHERGARWLVEAALLWRWEEVGAGRDPRRDPRPGDRVDHREVVTVFGREERACVRACVEWRSWRVSVAGLRLVSGDGIPSEVWRWAGGTAGADACERDVASAELLLTSWRRWARGRKVLRRIGLLTAWADLWRAESASAAGSGPPGAS